MVEEQPLTRGDVERLCDRAIRSLSLALAIAMIVQYILLGLILWRVW
jgi:hypothetical protein